MVKRARILAALIACLLAACSQGPDADQETLCLRLIPAVFERGQDALIVVSESSRPREVFIRFALPEGAREHVIYCRFAGSGFSLQKRLLMSVAADGIMLSDSAVHFLRERWLESQDAVAVAPRPARPAGRDGYGLDPPMAYALQQMVSALPRTGIIVLLAAAYALLYGLTGRINLAFGAFAALGGIAATMGIAAFDIAGEAGLPAVALFGVASGATLSALYGLVVARAVVAPLVTRPGQHLLVASAGLMVLIEEYLRLAQGANTRWLAPVLNSPMVLVRSPSFDVTVTPMALAVTLATVVTALGLLLFLHQSPFGRRWRAVSDDPVAAVLFGIATGGMVASTFALSAALAGFAGTLVAVHYGGMGFSGGAMLGFTALVAAILGGIGSVGGAMLGGLAVSALEAAWSAVLPIEYREVAVFLLLALILALKPDGLLAGRQPGPMRV